MPTCASHRSTTLRRSQWVASPLAALALQQTCLAAQAEPAAAELKLDQRRLAAIAGLPPAPGSAAEAADLAILEWLQRFRSPEIVATTWLLLDRDLNVFSSAVGTELGKATPMLSAGLHAFMAPVNSANRGIKQQQGRIRPYIAHPGLEPCLPRENTGSFPSGHAVWFRSTAELLADLLPERRERLHHVGRQGGANRVLCGACITPPMWRQASASVPTPPCRSSPVPSGEPSGRIRRYGRSSNCCGQFQTRPCRRCCAEP